MTLELEAAEFNKQLTPEARKFLNERGIPNEVIERYQLGYQPEGDFGWITIPIRSNVGELLFFKKRRFPYDADSDQIKFLYYPKGEATLFNTEVIKDKKFAVICEGEMDALLLTANGIPAVSSTSGALSFKPEWVDQLRHLDGIIICYDNDKAGESGANKLAELLYVNLDDNGIYIYKLPKEVGDGGDVTDFIVNLGRNGDDILSDSIRYLPAELVTAKQLCQTVFDPAEKWVIDRILPKDGITLITSQPKSFKTWIILHAAKALSEGSLMFGHFPVKKSRVLIVNEENSPRTMQERSIMVGLDHTDDVFFRNLYGIKIDNIKDIKYLQNLIRRERLNVIIFDNLVRIHDKDENSATEMRHIFENLKEILKMGVSIIITHHQNKGMFANGSRAYRGSSEIAAFVNCGFSIDKTGKKGKVILSNDLCRDDSELEKMAINVAFHDGKAAFTLLNKVETMTLLTKEVVNRIYSVIAQFEEPINIQVLMDNLEEKVSQKVVEKYCHQLNDEELILITKGDNNANLYQAKK